jgi:threonine dehydrogenase-like Zn-dependent dehydrogenase
MAYRRSLASSLGFKVLDPSEGPLAEQLKQQSGEPDIGLCFDCAAHPQVQNTILDLTRIRGTMVVVGSYKAPAPVDLLKIEFKELTIIGTRVYTRDDFRVAIDMIMDGRIDPDPLLTDFKPEDGPRLFNLLPGGVDIIKGIFNFGEWHEG